MDGQFTIGGFPLAFIVKLPDGLGGVGVHQSNFIEWTGFRLSARRCFVILAFMILRKYGASI